MEEIRLCDIHGKVVKTASIQRSPVAPQVILWGHRAFSLNFFLTGAGVLWYDECTHLTVE